MVEWKTIGELGTFYGGLTGKSKNDFTDGNAKFVSYMNVYSHPKLNDNITETVKVSANEKQNKIQCGDILFTGSSETPDECGMSSVVCKPLDEDVYLNSFCFGFRWNDTRLFIPEFMSHLFRSNLMRNQIYKTANGVTRFNVSKKQFAKITIPILPLSEQQRIVDTLDTFTASIRNIRKQITQRRKQYEYYIDQLFSFEGRKDVEWKTLADTGTFTRGKRFVRADNVEDGVPCIHYGDMYTKYGLVETETQTHLTEEKAKKLRFAHKGDVVIVAAGENDWDIGVGMAWMGEDAAAVHDACFIFEHKQNPMYIAYYMRTYQYHHQIQMGVVDGKICSISALELGKAIIPLPSLEEQSHIVSILNSFAVNILNLRRQLVLRMKQYKYYREKLLTFE